jgi:hypothetical protein
MPDTAVFVIARFTMPVPDPEDHVGGHQPADRRARGQAGQQDTAGGHGHPPATTSGRRVPGGR